MRKCAYFKCTKWINCKMHIAYLSLGTNLGNRAQNIEAAIKSIKHLGKILQQSSLYVTDAWGKSDQPAFYNLALCLETKLDVKTLLHELLSVETAMGRVRHDKWGPRLIDIDILLFDDLHEQIPGLLTIPHPEMQNRKFVLKPLVEIASSIIHPIFMKTMMTLLSELQDPLEVKKIEKE